MFPDVFMFLFSIVAFIIVKHFHYLRITYIPVTCSLFYILHNFERILDVCCVLQVFFLIIKWGGGGLKFSSIFTMKYNL